MGNKKEHKIENEIEMKHCPTCDSWKVLSEYNKQSSSWDKLRNNMEQSWRMAHRSYQTMRVI